MALPKLDQKTLDTAQHGFVRLVANATEVTPTSLEEVITGVSPEKGFYLGGLSAAPSLGSSDEMVDQVENIYGVFGPVRGAFQIQSTTSMVTVSLLKATPKVLAMVFPDFRDDGAWGDATATAASLTIGTGTSGVVYTAQSAGTSGNSIRVAHITPSTANAALSVTVAGNDITVNLATGATAGTATSTAIQVRDAVNANAAAFALAAASLAGDGSGVAAAQALTALSGGTGLSYGKKFSRSGQITNANYLDNICICYEGQNSDSVGMIVKLNSVLNRADDKSLEADDDGNLYGFEVELTGHEDFSGALGGVRVAPMEFYLPTYMLDPAAA